MENLKQVIEVVENLGWDINVDGNDFSLQRFSPAGQDFNIEINAQNTKDFINQLVDRYDGFDVSYETYLWLDNEGHGMNGAPYDMKDLYEDMEICEQRMGDLANALESIEFDEE